MQIDIFSLLVGDIIELDTGDKIPCDGIIFESNGMLVDESSATGESVLKIKSHIIDGPQFESKSNPFLISGT